MVFDVLEAVMNFAAGHLSERIERQLGLLWDWSIFIELYYRSAWNPDSRCLVGGDERTLYQRICSACRASTVLVPADRISAEELAQFHLA